MNSTSFPTLWYSTELPKDIIEILEKDIQKFDSEVEQSQLYGSQVDKFI